MTAVSVKRFIGLPYLLIEIFYIGMPVVRTVARSVYGHVVTKFSRMVDYHIIFLTYGAPLRALRAGELRYDTLEHRE